MKDKIIIPVIFGIKGTSLTEDERSLFAKYQVQGFILFARNIESGQQVLELTNSLRALYLDQKILIFVDQEGGRVARIKPPIASKLYPPAQHFSKIYDEDKLKAKKELEASYKELMSDLMKLGIDSPCAPVCDLLFKGASSVIGDRSFGHDPEKVVDLCRSAIAGIVKAGGLPFIKHIPGHGRAKVDSHFDLPVVDTPVEELEATDFKVFKDLTSEGAWAMTAHIIYSSIDQNLPATTSPSVIQYIRDNIGFKGTLVSDDLGMYALHGKIGQKLAMLKKVITLAQNEPSSAIIETCQKKLTELKPEFLESLAKAANMTINAGCDLVLHCSGDIDEMNAICGAIQ